MWTGIYSIVDDTGCTLLSNVYIFQENLINAVSN